jgi:hypothetical protein
MHVCGWPATRPASAPKVKSSHHIFRLKDIAVFKVRA